MQILNCEVQLILRLYFNSSFGEKKCFVHYFKTKCMKQTNYFLEVQEFTDIVNVSYDVQERNESYS